MTAWRHGAQGWPGRWLACTAVVAAVLAGVAGCSTGGNSGTKAAATASPSPASPAPSVPGTGGALQLQSQFERVVQTVLPSVVQITTSQGLGSGVVFDHSGDVVTNAHVVGSATSVTVRAASSSKELHAKVLGVFAPDDLAVIRVSSGAGALRPARFATSSDVRVGEITLAMGNPLGLTGTVTEGIVSATGRNVSEGQGSTAVLISAIQTSAAINPGNSGGALVDLAGRVIGIPTLAASDPQLGGAAVGIGFAIPSDTVTRIAPQLISSGKVTNSGRAALGITAETVANAAGQPAGVGVVRVTPGGGAARAGIKPGDIILRVAGKPTGSVNALVNVLAGKKPGDQVQVRYRRDGATHTVTVTLSNLSS
ncbi:MAG: trypsin-like peptidase domain-containing protein [Actinobacteria bacterium]|nr:trypsin-like peptidase domain-containing protein [Actinomycetota bacterium]